MELKHTRTDT